MWASARHAELWARLQRANELREEVEALAPRHKARVARLLRELHDEHHALVERGFLNASAPFAPLVAAEATQLGC